MRKKVVDLKFSEISTFFDSIKVKEICEDFKYLPDTAENSEILKFAVSFDFDQIGLFNGDNEIITQIARIENHTTVIKENLLLSHLISETVALSNAALLLKDKPFLFVLRENRTLGILTPFDFHKIPARLYIFGLISLTEINLTKLIRIHYKNSDEWHNLISAERLQNARTRKEMNKLGELLENLQICDKKEIVCGTPALITDLSISKKKFRAHMESFEKIRNNIAHSQDKISSEFKEILDLILISKRIINLSESK